MSSLLNNRVIFSDNGTLTDMTDHLNNYNGDSEALSIVAAEDAIYISSILPFNHRYFLIDSANVSATDIQVHLWDSSEWKAAADILDQTINAARDTSMATSGHVSWVLDKDFDWLREDTDRMTGSGLQTLKIYDHYWARITFSADCAFTLKYLGHKFSEDFDLDNYGYPDLNTAEVRLQYNNGTAKANWDEQLITAAQEIVADLAFKDVIVDRSQVLRWDLFRQASTHKLAEKIYNSWGKDGEDQRKVAREYYVRLLSDQYKQLDQNQNSRLELDEVAPSLRIRRDG